MAPKELDDSPRGTAAEGAAAARAARSSRRRASRTTTSWASPRPGSPPKRSAALSGGRLRQGPGHGGPGASRALRRQPRRPPGASISIRPPTSTRSCPRGGGPARRRERSAGPRRGLAALRRRPSAAFRRSCSTATTTGASPGTGLLVRPFAPDIGRIPEAERAYYEKYMTVTFNNPNLVDLGTDILWTLMTHGAGRRGRGPGRPGGRGSPWTTATAAILKNAVRQGGRRRASGFHRPARPPPGPALLLPDPAQHGGLGGRRPRLHRSQGPGRERHSAWPWCGPWSTTRSRTRSTLAALFESSKTRFMPVDPAGETFNMYGTNLAGAGIGRKAALMKKHRDDEPRIDPDFMWRLPPDAGLDPKLYLKYRP
ncbi:MAG: hypothetical protein M0C28_14995 [Candidatus Moduliflexus flocculans]|nr:hypothetical protein [Candidatus Moduliflexus flocculans]